MSTLRELAAKAAPGPFKLWRYSHGGGRLSVLKGRDEGSPVLVADFYNEDDREYITALLDAAPLYFALEDAAREWAAASDDLHTTPAHDNGLRLWNAERALRAALSEGGSE